jgi:hypothetical protein
MGVRFAALTLAIMTFALAAGCANQGPTRNYQGTATAGTDEDFDDAAVGTVPSGWTAMDGTWDVVANSTAPSLPNAMMQSGGGDGVYPMLMKTDAGTFGNFEASLKFNLLGGAGEKTGGLAFRMSAGKYYAIDYDVDEMSWSLYRFANSQMTKVAGLDGVPTHDIHRWISLTVHAEGAHITAYDVTSGNVKVLDFTENDASAPMVGELGFWVKNDAAVLFDSFEAEPLSAAGA